MAPIKEQTRFYNNMNKLYACNPMLYKQFLEKRIKEFEKGEVLDEQINTNLERLIQRKAYIF